MTNFLRQLYYHTFNYGVNIRHIPVKSLSRKAGPPKRAKHWANRDKNPGIQNLLKLNNPNKLSENESGIEEEDELQMESDFMNVGNSYSQHKKELSEEKEIKHLRNIGRKYFKDKKEPNLLTWAEKEQIRYLHGQDQEEWSIERLATSFPASEHIIKKIINASWKPESSARIAKHDDNVKNNWKLLTAGKLEVSPELKVHIEKFASRHNFVLSQPETPGLLITHTSQEAEKVSEFGNIIQSYKILKTEKSANLIGANSVSPVLVGEQMERSPFKELDTRKKIGPPVTLDKYREENPGCIPQQLEAKDAMGKLFADDELHIETKPMTKFKTKNVQKYVQKSSKVQEIKSSEYPEKIKIPKGKWLKGATYKVSDRYYDDDGWFLYRVPGMQG